MDLKFSKVTRKGPITTITLSRPEVYNALHIDAHFELNKVFDTLVAKARQPGAVKVLEEITDEDIENLFNE